MNRQRLRGVDEAGWAGWLVMTPAGGGDRVGSVGSGGRQCSVGRAPLPSPRVERAAGGGRGCAVRMVRPTIVID